MMKFTKLAAVFLSAAIIATASFTFPVSGARTVDDIKAEQQALADKQEELKSQIAQLEDKETVSLEYQQKLKEEMTVVEEQLTAITNSITELDASIFELDAKIKKSESEHTEVFETLKERIKALYKTGGIGTLEILLNSESFHEYSMRAELMKSMTKHDRELMDQISEYLKSTEAERKQLEEEKEAVATLKKSQEAKTAELETLSEKNNATLEELKLNKSLTENTLEESYGYGDDLANEMAAKIAAMSTPKPTPTPEPTEAPEPTEPPAPETTTDPDTGEEVIVPTPVPTETPEPTQKPDDSGSSDSIGFQWPCPGYSYISAGWMGYPGHKGLDMAANYGTPIYAAASGQVIMANDSDSWGYSWGYYVSIYHNGTYSTLYAHCSSLAVSTGDYVEQGQLIGYVGSTGNSTGNHLHFEVYEYGSRVDPAQFF